VVRLGRGDGTFKDASFFSNNTFDTFGLALGDLNEDGILDLITTGQEDSMGVGLVTIRLGNGDVTFNSAISFAAEQIFARAVTLGDLNGDGVLDLVTGGRGAYGGENSIRLGHGDGTFGNVITHIIQELSSLSVTLGDLNKDGVLDLVTVRDEGGNNQTTIISLGTGDGSFTDVNSFACYGSAASLGDLNGDGVLDLVTGGAEVRLGKGDGTFNSAEMYSAASNAISLGDINGDASLDIVGGGFANYYD